MTSNYLAQIREEEIRRAILDGLSYLNQTSPSQEGFTYKQVVGQLAKLVQDPTKALTVWDEWQGAPPDPQRLFPDNVKILSVFWMLIGEGIIYPLLGVKRDGYPAVIQYVFLTERGRRLVKVSGAHPLHPGYIQRFRADSPHVTDEIVARLEDASQCLARNLLRAAVVMVGLAAEETIRVTHKAMVHMTIVQPKPSPAQGPNTRDLVADIRAGMGSWQAKADAKHRLNMSLVAVENVRIERNKASHPGAANFDTESVEELLVSSARQLPTFWGGVIADAVKQGFVVS